MVGNSDSEIVRLYLDYTVITLFSVYSAFEWQFASSVQKFKPVGVTNRLWVEVSRQYPTSTLHAGSNVKTLIILILKNPNLIPNPTWG